MFTQQMRYAFERDLVRRKGHYPKQLSRTKMVRGWKGTCKVCLTVYKKPCWNSITCSKACAAEQHRRRNRE